MSQDFYYVRGGGCTSGLAAANADAALRNWRECHPARRVTLLTSTYAPGEAGGHEIYIHFAHEPVENTQ